MEEPQYSLASDNSKKAAKQFVDPETGGYYVRHAPEEDMGGRGGDRSGHHRGVGDDLYHDSYKERGFRGWRYEKREIADVRRVTKEKILESDRLRVAGYASAPIRGVEPPSVHVSAYKPFVQKKMPPGDIPTDPFAYVEPAELRRLVRAHNCVYTMTIFLAPKVMSAKHGFPDPPKTLEDHVAVLRQHGAVHEKTVPYQGGGKMAIFRFMEIVEDGSDRLRLEDEIRDLTEANLTSFVEDWVAVRLVLKLQKKKTYSIRGYFFTVG